MHHEIDRRFLIRDIPKLRGIEPVFQEQYFIQSGDIIEEKVQKKGGVFEYETEVVVSHNERTREKRVLSKDEFNTFKELAPNVVTKECYLLSENNPRISINIYKGEYKGLVLAEVEFDDDETRESFKPPEWMGIEITESPLVRDSLLGSLKREEFLKILTNELEKLNPEPESYM